MRCNVNGLLQELLNVNEENLREILEHDWLIDWVERAREETATYGFFQAFWFQLFIVHSFSVRLPLAVHLLSLALRVTCITLPNFSLQVVPPSQTPHGASSTKWMFRLLAGGGGLGWRLCSTWASSRFPPFSSSSLVSPVSQAMFGAMADKRRFFSGHYQYFLRLRKSVNFITENFWTVCIAMQCIG